MKRLPAIFMFILMMTTATFAGTGITATMVGRTAKVEVVDNGIYNVSLVNEMRFIDTNRMTEKSGAFVVEIPEGTDYVDVIVTNILTGATEVITLRVE